MYIMPLRCAFVTSTAIPGYKDRRSEIEMVCLSIVLLAGCSSKHDYTNPPWNAKVPVQRAMQWMPISQKAGAAWGVYRQLITAIIAIESGGNPNAVSKSNAIGLMQLKASTSGRDVYRRMGWSGEPTTSELKIESVIFQWGRLT